MIYYTSAICPLAATTSDSPVGIYGQTEINDQISEETTSFTVNESSNGGTRYRTEDT